MFFRRGVSIEVYEELVTSLLGQKELLETELAIIRSEWDVFFHEIRDYYTSVEAIEKFADLNVRQANVLEEIKKVKFWLQNATARESRVTF